MLGVDDFTQKLLLAFVAFFLGLLAEGIKRFFQKEKRRVRYSVVQRPVLAINKALPQAVLAKLPNIPPGNVSEFRIQATNTGNLAASAANLLIVPSEGCQLLHYEVETIPPREVAYSAVEHPNPNEVRCPGINLEKDQTIVVRVFFLSKTDMEVKLYWSGGGSAVEWEEGESRFSEGAALHVEGIIRNYILSEIVSVLLLGIGYVIGALVPSSMESSSRITMAGVGVGQLLGALMRLYFLLRIVPHAIALVEMFRRRAQPAPK
jgi:hypothetical protein